MIKAPFLYQRGVHHDFEVVDANSQVIAIVPDTLSEPCQETTAKVIALALNDYIAKQKVEFSVQYERVDEMWHIYLVLPHYSLELGAASENQKDAERQAQRYRDDIQKGKQHG